ncbi:MAG: prephenate dehydrogenase/arogenate dehydrogenase family protein, partial [Deltaproteobacteria bacterium]|nr:prephenate dehydrogenase/arogenate dehydrogenase family protein [Deltaproteobacteria bacterium]
AKQSWCDAVASLPEEAVKGADLVVIGTPVETIPSIVEKIASSFEQGVIVTDVGSVKSLICRSCGASMPSGTHFVGSHPMAGSEKKGMEFAHSELLDGQACFVTPLADSDPVAAKRIVRLWQQLGMRVSVISPEEHDKIVANISHLPHLLASCLCSYLATRDPNWSNLAGKGLRDTTRVAAGDPGLWKGIIDQNREEILHSLTGYREELNRFEAALNNRESLEFFGILERGKDYRDCL